MACYYHLRLPAGGEIRIPASFSNLSLTDSENLRGLIDNYKNNKEDSKTELISYIKNNTPLKNQAITSLVESIPIDNAQITDEHLTNFIAANNEQIEAQGEFAGIADTLRTAIYKDNKIEAVDENGVWKEMKIDQVLKELQKPIFTNYFQNIDAAKVLNGKSYNKTIDDIKFRQAQLDSLGINSDIFSDFQTVLSYAFPNQKGIRTANNFFKTKFNSKSGVGQDDSVLIYDKGLENPLIFYNENSDLSLHFAVFKILGIKALEGKNEKLKELIEGFNKDAGEQNQIDTNLTPIEFFNGQLNAEKERLDPEFYKMLKFKYGERWAKKIIDLMVEDLPETDKLRLGRSLTSILNFMDPSNMSKFDEAILKTKNNTKELYNVRIQGEQLQIQSIYQLSSRQNRPLHYNFAEESQLLATPNDINNFLNSKIRRNLDIIKIEIEDPLDPTKKYSPRYIVPTYWSVRDNSVFIRGWYDNNGTLTRYEGMIKPNRKITYSTFASAAKPYVYTTDIKAKIEKPLIVKIDTENPLPNTVLLKLIQRGTYIKYLDNKGVERNGNVKNVFPGGVKMNTEYNKTGAFEPDVKLYNIREIHTDASSLEAIVPDALLKSDADVQTFLMGKAQEIIKGLEKWDRNAPVSEDDWVAIESNGQLRYNMVIGQTNKKVYIFIQTSKGSRIETINKSEIKNVYKPKEKFDTKMFAQIGSFYNTVLNEHSIRDYGYSVFTDYERAMDGDYVWSKENKVLYKISNKENKQLIKFAIKNGAESIDYVSEFPVDAVFITDRNIASNNFASTIEFNNFHLSTFSLDPDSKEKRGYFVPKDAVLSSEMLLPSGNLTVGFVHFADFKYDPNVYRDATAEVVKLINERDGKKGKAANPDLAIFQEKGYIKRYDANLYGTQYDKSKNKFLQQGVYVTLAKEDGSASHKYRVESRDGDKLLLEYNTYNRNGKVLTVNKYLDLSKDEGSIKNLYIMFGNSRLKELQALDTKNDAVNEKMTKTELMNNITDSFYQIYNIDVATVHSEEKGLKKRKAWIDASSGGNKIVINTNVPGSEQELVHEYLHLFLMGAKYNNGDVYETLMTNYLKSKGESTENINLEQVEERFVNEVNELMWKDPEKLISIDVKSFTAMFDRIMKDLKVIEEDDETFSPERGSFESVFNILNYKMEDIFKGETSRKSKTNLLYYDANFKNWLNDQIDNNNLLINCR